MLWLPSVPLPARSTTGVIAALKRAVADRLKALSMALSALAGVPMKLRVVAEPIDLSKVDVAPRRERRNDLGDRVASAIAMSSWESLPAEKVKNHDNVNNGAAQVNSDDGEASSNQSHENTLREWYGKSGHIRQAWQARSAVTCKHGKPLYQAELCVKQVAITLAGDASLTCHSAACVENCCYAHALLKG